MIRTLLLALVAQSAFGAAARHEDVVFKAWKDKGRLKGFTLTLTLRPSSYKTAQVAIGSNDVSWNQKQTDARRRAGWDPKKGYLRLVFPMETGLEKLSDKEVTYQVEYGNGNDLKPGQKIDLVSAFTNATAKQLQRGGQYVHIYGMTYGPATRGTEVYPLPDGNPPPKARRR